MVVRSNMPRKSGILIDVIQKRYLFQNFRQNFKPFKEHDDAFHHEYSIRPDTFAFKVSAANETTRSLTKRDNNKQDKHEPKAHPFQKNATEGDKFNIVDFIYKNSTNYPFDTKSPQEVYNEYPTTNSEKLARSKTRPKKVKMSASDFIEDSLYNPHYGYFSKKVEIFHPDKPFEYNNIKDVDEFMDNWQNAYKKYDEIDPRISNIKQQYDDILVENESKIKSKFALRAQSLYKEELIKSSAPSARQTKRSLQLWHTPTELFQPYYGEALARYILVNYKLNGNFPYNDLLIYEIGGGNGTLMCNILHYIKENEPEVYLRTKYRIIEISDQLVAKQTKNLLSSKLMEQGLDSKKFEIINKSIFKWDHVVEEPCFLIALEVFDNFAHDLIRYDNNTGVPYEGKVLIDKHGDFYEFFTPELSYYSNAYLQLRENSKYSVLNQSNTMYGKYETFKSIIPFLTNKDKIHPLYHSTSKLSLKNSILPFKDNLTPGEFIPTRLLQFFQVLNHKFPQHSLISSDFHYLPKAIEGYYNAPVVQTVLGDKMIDISTYMSYQGYFDIMFPTNFDIASEMYKQVTKKISRVETHKEFLEQWADLDLTSTKTGENPMLDFYKNVSFMVS